jgi:hypothetical protein
MSKSASARGRKPGFVMPEAHRLKIQNSNILNALVEHAEGKRDMSATQVSAGLGLLRKVMPDLAATTISGDAENPVRLKVEQDAERFTSGIARVASRKGKG